MFKRKGSDLIMEKTLSLAESLCGFCFTITHLDQRVLKVRSPFSLSGKRGEIFPKMKFFNQ